MVGFSRLRRRGRIEVSWRASLTLRAGTDASWYGRGPCWRCGLVLGWRTGAAVVWARFVRAARVVVWEGTLAGAAGWYWAGGLGRR